MPYPNEHSARLQDPKRFSDKTFRRVNDGTIYGKIKVPQTVAVIWGKLKGRDKPSDNPIPQALRFPVKYWTAEKAKKWLKDNNVKYQRFEPAKKEKEKSDAATNIFALIAELEAQFWAMEPRALKGLFNQLDQQQVYIPDDIVIEGQARIKPLRIIDGTAIVEIKGVLLREVPRAFDVWGIDATSYDQIAQQVIEAITNDQAKEILLTVNSPGGAVPGVLETAEVIRAARGKKPVTARVDDIGASAAYWLASQANQIYAEANTEVGAIGVFAVYVDSSKRAQDMGFKVHVIKSGPYKGMGIPGVEITETQIASIQDIVNGIADNFVNSVAKGRQREEKTVRGWADGRLWLADRAVQMGLIDKISASKLVKKVKTVKEKTMDSETAQIDEQIEANQLTEQMQQAERKRMGDLKAAFPDDLDFAMKSFEEGLSVDQAKAKYCDILAERLREKDKQTPSGAQALASGDSDDEQQQDFIEEAREMAEQKNITVTEAMRRLKRSNPQMYEAMLEKARLEGAAVFNQY